MPVKKIKTVSFEDEIVNELKRLKNMPGYEQSTYSDVINMLVRRGLAIDEAAEKNTHRYDGLTE